MVTVATSLTWFKNKTNNQPSPPTKKTTPKTQQQKKLQPTKPKAKLLIQLSDNEAEKTSVLLVAEISHLLILPFLREYRCTEVASCDQGSKALMVEKETIFLNYA